MAKVFDKYIIAKYSPKNQCNVADGEPLIVLPLKNVDIKKDKQHHFLNAGDLKTKSRYGWVKSTTHFTLQDFIIQHVKSNNFGEEDLKTVEMMFQSIENLPDGTPVTTDYSIHGVIQKKAVLTVHKVIFYKKKQ